MALRTSRTPRTTAHDRAHDVGFSPAAPATCPECDALDEISRGLGGPTAPWTFLDAGTALEPDRTLDQTYVRLDLLARRPE